VVSEKGVYNPVHLIRNSLWTKNDGLSQILRIIIAILRHFKRVYPNQHIEICPVIFMCAGMARQNPQNGQGFHPVAHFLKNPAFQYHDLVCVVTSTEQIDKAPQ
jgi:hypothetical protein